MEAAQLHDDDGAFLRKSSLSSGTISDDIDNTMTNTTNELVVMMRRRRLPHVFAMVWRHLLWNENSHEERSL